MSKTIEEIKKNIAGQKVLLNKYEKMKNTKMASKIKAKITDNEEMISKLVDESEVVSDWAIKEPKKGKSDKLVGGMTKESCIAFLNNLAVKEGIRNKENISSGRADSTGSLKASSSLENEAETIENKADSGQTLNKNEQKKVAVNIDKIMNECVKMIKTKKDAVTLIRDLVKNLNSLLEDIKEGKISYEG
jgi:hypothetical protein